MFTLSNKRKEIRIITLVLGFVAMLTIALSLIAKNVIFGANAITADGAAVNVVAGQQVSYGNWTTNYFTVSGEVGFCAQPNKSTTSGSYPADKITSSDMKYKKIKLMIWLFNAWKAGDSDATQIMNDFFSTISDEITRYAYVHGAVGYIYEGSTNGLDSGQVQWVQTVSSQLAGFINGNNPVWIKASNYQLYGLDPNSLGSAQNIMWIEDASFTGNIEVQKCDAETQSCIAQGGASLKDIEFSVYNNSGSSIYFNGKIYTDYVASASDNSGALIATKKTNSSGKATFSDLPGGVQLIVVETATNSSYELPSSASDRRKNVTISSSGETKSLEFYDEVSKGKIVFKKTDKETEACKALGSASLMNTTFEVYNANNNAIDYGEKTVEAGGLAAQVTVTASNCQVTVSGLPYGKYKVKETHVGTGYILNSSEKTITIPTDNNTTINVSYENQVIRGDVKFKKVDEKSGEVMANIPFKITSNTTGENHIVVTDNNGVVDTSAIQHSTHTNGYDSISDPNTITYKGYGTWFGLSGTTTVTVDNSLGALPYDTYTVVEIACDQNKYCYDIPSQTKTFTISKNSTTVDLGTWNNDCAEFSLGTMAYDKEDEDKFVFASEEATIQDKVSYCVKKNQEFILKGILMDKATGEALEINGETIEASLTINSETECGEVTMDFGFDASKLSGKEIVVFERLYDGDELLAEHADIDDEDQFVNIVNLGTMAHSGTDGGNKIEKSEKSTIIDEVSYCLRAGEEFTLKGVLMNKNTGRALTIDGEEVENSLTFTPDENCGKVNMQFEFDSSELEDMDVVAFESVYLDDELVVSHEDIEDAAQTITLVAPPEEPVIPDIPETPEKKTVVSTPETPETGKFVSPEDGGNGNVIAILLAAPIVVVLGYFGARYCSRKKFLR